jgi:hypothetical protein
LLAVTFCPLPDARPLAVSSGYGVQLQLVPRGTESPNATIDHARDAPVAVEEGDVVEDAAAEEGVVADPALEEAGVVVVEVVADSRDELAHPLARQQSATRPAIAAPSFRLSTSRV